jgi:hypothetical protein
MIHRQFSNTRSAVPNDYIYLGQIWTHYQSGSQLITYYASIPLAKEDADWFEQKRLGVKKYNEKKIIPSWV